MRLIILTLALLILASAITPAQEAANCPPISVTGPSAIPQPGEEIQFIVDTGEAGKKYNLKYRWSTSIGEILSGQGTSSIKIKWPAGVSLTATVEIAGLPDGCRTTASETGIGCEGLPIPVMIDEFGKLPRGSVRTKLDKFFAELNNNPGNQAYIILYGTNKEIAAQERLLVSFTRFRHFDRSRLTSVRGGTHESGKIFTKLYRIPPGAYNPHP